MNMRREGVDLRQKRSHVFQNPHGSGKDPMVHGSTPMLLLSPLLYFPQLHYSTYSPLMHVHSYHAFTFAYMHACATWALLHLK